MIVIWEFRGTVDEQAGAAVPADLFDSPVPVVSLDSYQAVCRFLQRSPCEALLVLCEWETLPAHVDLRPLVEKAPVYVCLNAGVEAKLILHYFLFYLLSRAHVDQAGPVLDEPDPSASKSAGGIDWRDSIRYIHSNMARNDLSLEEVASQNYVCKWHYSKLFKQRFGITFREYLITARIERAKQMLKANRSVTDVCYAVGYGDLAHFGRIFRKKVGMSPSDYKRRYRSTATMEVK
ncbi:MAG: helix-turn-helix transcriptional regulator [Brevibacillus sp.]|nr:helix-turn-helix transcriptional regulator [Brevibacillus sp.]